MHHGVALLVGKPGGLSTHSFLGSRRLVVLVVFVQVTMSEPPFGSLISPDPTKQSEYDGELYGWPENP